MYEDKILKCRDCGQEFTFTAGEQEFYAERGFNNAPSRCKACRDAKKSAAKPQNPMMQKYYREIEDSLSSQFGTKVKIQEGAKKGKIEIEYYSKDDLERLLFVLRR